MKHAIFFNSLAGLMHAADAVNTGPTATNVICVVIAVFVSYVLLKNI